MTNTLRGLQSGRCGGDSCGREYPSHRFIDTMRALNNALPKPSSIFNQVIRKHIQYTLEAHRRATKAETDAYSSQGLHFSNTQNMEVDDVSDQNFSWNAQWLIGRVLDSRPKGRGFEPHRRHCAVSLSKNINPSLVLVQPRKIRPFLTERLLMGRKKSNQTKQKVFPLFFL